MGMIWTGSDEYPGSPVETVDPVHHKLSSVRAELESKLGGYGARFTGSVPKSRMDPVQFLMRLCKCPERLHFCTGWG